jgi:Flp pilus assembly protein TadD
MTDELATAFQKHQTGQLNEAEAIYRSLAQLSPERADVRFLLGVLMMQTGRAYEAEPQLTKALSLSPGHADAAYNLGVARQALGNFRGAVSAYRLALKLGAAYPDVRLNLGAALQEMGQFAEGELAYMEALAQKPGDPGILGNLAQLLRATGRLDEALAAIDVALSGASGRLDLRLAKASTLKDLGRLDEALEALDDALKLDPTSAEVHNNRGVLLNDLGRGAEARQAFETALALKPAYAEAAGNLGNVLLGEGGLPEALAAYDKALDLKPELATARFNRGFARLLCGDYEGGWPDWEARFQLPDMQGFHLDGPVWDGQPTLKGPLLVQAEQGFGDTIHFLRYVPYLAAGGLSVIVRCQETLVSLVQRSFEGLAQVVSQTDPLPPYAAWVAVASLGHRLGTKRDNIPALSPYLLPSSQMVVAWAERLGKEGPKVGLVWRGNPGFKGEARRAPGLGPLKDLIERTAHLRWLSLQRDPFRQELFDLDLAGLVSDLGDGADPMVGSNFDSTAALIQNLDLLITSDTAVAHLAGALGVECWVMLSQAPDWRWGRSDASTPWYPSLRLFRQAAPGDWDSVAQSLRVAIQARFPDSPPP